MPAIIRTENAIRVGVLHDVSDRDIGKQPNGFIDRIKKSIQIYKKDEKMMEKGKHSGAAPLLLNYELSDDSSSDSSDFLYRQQIINSVSVNHKGETPTKKKKCIIM